MREIDEPAAGASRAGGDPGEERAAAELSRAAREAVRQSDPRIDRQLAKMGLGDEAGSSTDAPSPARPIRATDLEGLHDELAATRSEGTSLAAAVERLRGRVTLLGWLVGVEGVALVVVAALLLTR